MGPGIKIEKKNPGCLSDILNHSLMPEKECICYYYTLPAVLTACYSYTSWHTVWSSVCQMGESWKTAATTEMQFGLQTCMDSRKHILDGVHMGATQQTWLNDSCSAVMWVGATIIVTMFYHSFIMFNTSKSRSSICAK